MKPSIIIFFILFGIAQLQSQNIKPQDTCCISNLRNKGIENASIRNLSEEYKRLKTLDSTCCHKWNSDLHQIMSRLMVLLGKEGTNTKTITKYLGKPDANKKKIPEGIIKLNKGEKMMIYTWRGFHDFIYFVHANGKIKYAKWYMAWE